MLSVYIDYRTHERMQPRELYKVHIWKADKATKQS